MGTENILVFDAEPQTVQTISDCLRHEGFRVTGTTEGGAILHTVRSSPVDLVLLDISGSGISSLDIIGQILSVNSDTRIICTTTRSGSTDKTSQALKRGAWGCLTKPFGTTNLIRSVSNALNQKHLLRENRRLSAKLAATRKMVDCMINFFPDLIFILNKNNQFTFVNDGFEKLLGIRNDSLLRQPLSSILHPEDINKVSQLYEFSHARRFPDQDMSIRLRMKRVLPQNGEWAFVELQAVAMYLPVPGGREKFVGIYCAARDISLQVNLEDLLRQSQKMEAIGTLAGGIAHDFNNILMGIQGYASLVKTGLHPDSREFKRVSRIEDYIQSGAQMANQLLGFAQKGFDETSVMNLNQLLTLSVNMFGRTKKDIVIEQDLESGLWGARINESQIKQVLMNLFVNAWQAMPDGGVLYVSSQNVHIREKEKEALGLIRTGDYIKVMVADTGVGIDKDIMGLIFDPFFTTKGQGKGTGLGLATAYKIIKNHKGMLMVDSVPGQGSTFSFYLPAEKGQIHDHHPDRENDHIIEGKGHILLVDDEPGVTQVCSEMLTTLGYRVSAVNSGAAALQLITHGRHRFDLVLLDLVMPGMDGAQTFERIKAADPGLKVLISSGFTKKEKIQEMVKKGCDDYLLKPFDIAALSEKLDSLLKKA